MKTIKFIAIVLMALVTITVSAQRGNRFNGSTPPGAPVVINGSNFADKTRELRNAINSFGNSGGNIELSGKMTLQKTYLKSNIHVNIKKGTVIKLGGSGSNMFDLATRVGDSKIENVKFYCSDCTSNVAHNSEANKRYTIDISSKSPNQNANVWALGNVENFSISHFIVKDNFTKINAVSYNPVIRIPGGSDPLYEKNLRILGAPKKGDLKYGHIVNAHSGYGLVQTQAGQNLNFHHLTGVGGVTLRLESGAMIANVPTDEQPIGDLNDIEGYNIKCKKGYTTVLLSPHGRSQGNVTLKDIYAVSCNANITAAVGFEDRALDGLTGFPTDKFKKGTFNRVTIKGNISHVFGNEAQTEKKYFGFYPSCIRDGKNFDQKFRNSRHRAPYPDTETDKAKINAPSMANILYIARKSGTANVRAADGEYLLRFQNVTYNTSGFNTSVKNITYNNDKNNLVCPASAASMQPVEPIALSTLSAEAENKLYVDAASKTLHTSVSSSVVVYIYDISGRLVKTSQVNAGNEMISISDLQGGIYFAKFKLKGKVYTTKFYIK